jgi:hypothetical protein
METPMQRLTLEHRNGQHCGVLQANVGGVWASIMVLTDTRSESVLTAEWRARIEARAIGVRFES